MANFTYIYYHKYNQFSLFWKIVSPSDINPDEMSQNLSTLQIQYIMVDVVVVKNA